MEQNPFDTLASEYEAWFVDKKGVEIGIGSGIFAEQLSIKMASTHLKRCLNIPGKGDWRCKTG